MDLDNCNVKVTAGFAVIETVKFIVWLGLCGMPATEYVNKHVRYFWITTKKRTVNKE